MPAEHRSIYYDSLLGLEACYFEAIPQKFPNHFHDYYVIGLIELGTRKLFCKNKQYTLHAGDLFLLNPYDNHGCEQLGKQPLNYRSVHLKSKSMDRIAATIFQKEHTITFSNPVVRSNSLSSDFKSLHQKIFEKDDRLLREESFFIFMADLLQATTEIKQKESASDNLLLAVSYIDKHFQETVTLDKLSAVSTLNKYVLIRHFVKETGLTPYQYLQAVRINYGKKLLKQGVKISDVAFQTGFSDQSHFSRTFKSLIGLNPSQYRRSFIMKGS